MGRASNAVFWGDGSNYWGNPALLAIRKGIGYEWGSTQLVPDLADDVFFTTKRLALGYWGLGLLMAGRPFNGVGEQRLDYGVSYATDVDGNVIGTFSSYEEIESFGAAVSVLDFAEHVWRAAGSNPPPLSRFGDVAVGWTENKAHVFLFPGSLTLDGMNSEGSATTYDSGLLIRLTPYNAIDYAGFISALDKIARTRVDVSHGRSTKNYNDATITSIDNQPDPIARYHRTGWAAHVALDIPSSAQDALAQRGLGWLPAWTTPLVSWGKAWDKELPMILDPATGSHLPGTEVEYSGWELTVANIYSIRKGWVDDPAGTVQGPTTGWGLGLHLKNIAGFSYDHATVPQSKYLTARVDRKSVSFYVSPLEAWRSLHPGRTEAK
jgi:hypothetical protein